MRSYAVVILAAGRAKRFRAAGGSQPTKLLAEIDGRPVVRHVAKAAVSSCAAPVILVTGHAADPVRAALSDLPVTIVHNPDYASGLAGSLQAGVRALPWSCTGAIVVLADMPGVTSAILDALLVRADAHPEVDAVVPVCNGRRGNPVLLGRRLFPAVMRLSGDVGARHLLQDSSLHVEEVPLTSRGIFVDIDLPEHLVDLAGDEKPPFTGC